MILIWMFIAVVALAIGIDHLIWCRQGWPPLPTYDQGGFPDGDYEVELDPDGEWRVCLRPGCGSWATQDCAVRYARWRNERE